MKNKIEVISVNISINSIEITQLLRESFIGVAESMGITEENCPYNVAFITQSQVIEQLDRKNVYCFGIQENSKWIGFVAIAPYDNAYEITRLAVLPEYRHKGYGRALMDFACEKSRKIGLDSIGLGIINENTVLKNWYITQGFVAGEPFKPTGNAFAMCGMSKKL